MISTQCSDLDSPFPRHSIKEVILKLKWYPSSPSYFHLFSKTKTLLGPRHIDIAYDVHINLKDLLQYCKICDLKIKLRKLHSV